MANTLRLILGDQLNSSHSWFKTKDQQVVYALMEVRTETDYTQHHIQKVCGIFAAMRHFSEELKSAGHRVVYLALDDAENKQQFEANLMDLFAKLNIQKFEYMQPDEWRLDQVLATFSKTTSLECMTCDTEHFYTSRGELKAHFTGKKQLVMESFYRSMRKKHGVLMVGDQPEQGVWNFDGANRNKLPERTALTEPKLYQHDVSDIVAMVENAGVKTIGKIDPKRFTWPISRAEGLELLSYFTGNLLPQFGHFQDAMTTRDWSLFHSRLSFALNLKMISPIEVVNAVELAWRENPVKIDIAQTEGFIRQILGWREYMRGIYWWKMPDFGKSNFFDHTRPLPAWFWSGETNMNCLKHAINQSLDHAYAHHIQRLMVTGNFALLNGTHPDEVDAWYLGIYIDAFEWVEITNTRGMSQFADGGIVGTKPYVSSAAYMHKMSDYCSSCHYQKDLKVGDRACPFNSLYWHFHHRHRDKLERNPRIGMMYKTWDKMPAAQQNSYLQQAERYLDQVDYL